MKRKIIYVLGIAPYQHILHDLEFDNKADANRRARDENQVGEYRGRGVRAYKLSELRPEGL